MKTLLSHILPSLHCLLEPPRTLLAGLCALILCQFPAGAMSAVPREVELAILQQKWQQVLQLLPGDDTSSLPATLRLIKGNACLASNQNNISFSLFLSVTAPEERAEYQEWAVDFASRNPRNPMAHFFAGDAFARHTNWPAALAEFKMAISLDPNATLAYNARAVVHAKLNEEDLAEQDFTEAIRTSNYGLADAYCGMGFLWIQRKDGPDGALDCFQKALDINIKFALAWHGKACIELTQRDAQNATNSIENSLKCTRSNPKDPASIDWKIARRMIANVDAFCLKQQGRTNDVLLADAFDPGSSFTEMENSQDQMQKINDMKEQVQNTISSSAATIADMKDRLNNNLGNSFPQPGGVLAGITVMNGNWPFRPLYGTAYGLR